MNSKDTKSTHSTTTNAIEILDFIRRADGARISDVMDECNMSRSTAYTHLNTLKQEGLIVRQDGQYCIGLRFREFSVCARNRKPSFQIVKKKMRELAEETDDEIEFLVEETGRIHLVYHSETVSHNRVRLYLHNTAAGKAILAEFPVEKVNEIIERWGMPRHTPNTITDKDELFAQLESIKEQGYAYNNRECFEGYHGIGASIKGINGSTLGALTIGGLVYRVQEETLKNEMAELLQETVNEIETTIESQREVISAELANRS